MWEELMSLSEREDRSSVLRRVKRLIDEQVVHSVLTYLSKATPLPPPPPPPSPPPPKPAVSPDSQIELEINVQDERKQMRSTFRCSKQLLVSTMGYFKDVSAGQRLEDMDIAVHCDIQVFDWLMRWVKRKSNNPAAGPVLEIDKVVPILVSSFFLRMTGLVKECLKFFKQNANEVLARDPNISCINEKILEKISDMFSNEEVESLVDEKDKIQSKLYIRLIVALWRGDHEERKGHFGTLKYLRKCALCQKIVDLLKGHMIPCTYENLRMDTQGNVHGIHVPEAKWTLNNYIRKLRHELRSWRKIYWKLWGLCHYLYCRNCSSYFPAFYAKCCLYHPSPASFHGRQNQIQGQYLCCGQKVFQFEALPSYFGCQSKNHVPQEKSNIPSKVYEIFRNYEPLIVADNNELTLRRRPSKAGTYVNSKGAAFPGEEVICWFGMNQFPPSNSCILGLPRISSHWRERRMQQDLAGETKKALKQTSSPDLGNASNKIRQSYCNETDVDGDFSDETIEEDTEHDPIPDRVHMMFTNYFSSSRKKRKSLKNFFKTHPNEPENAQDDFMREHENKLMMILIGKLVKKNASKDVFCDIWPKYSHISGGAYSQLEADWREENMKPTSSGGSSYHMMY